MGEERLGVKEEIELVKGGKDREVNGGNVNEYLEANFKYRLLENIRPQLTEILLGFFDVIPEPLLTVFDFQELELVLCGMPTIDLVDWKSNTLYAGEFFKSHQVCKWFWQIVEDDFSLSRVRVGCLPGGFPCFRETTVILKNLP